VAHRKSFTTLLLALLTSIQCYGGNEIGNGGDAVVEEFVQICRKLSAGAISAYAKANPSKNVPQLELSKVCSGSTILSVEGPLELNNIPKDAINYPGSNRIEIHRSRWLALPFSMKVRLTLHEMLGFVGIDDRNYIWTDTILEFSPAAMTETHTTSADRGLIEWRQSVVEKLTIALRVGLNSQTQAEEVQVLSSTIRDVLNTAASKTQRDDVAMLYAAIADVEVFATNSRVQVGILRRMLSFTIQDLNSVLKVGAVTPTRKNSSDVITTQIQGLFMRLTALGYQTTENREEIYLLLRGSYMALSMIDNFDGAKSQQLESIYEELLRVREVFESENLVDSVKVQQMRRIYLNVRNRK
jgi:hypothetical protein